MAETNTNTDPNGEKGKITFTEEQQAHINKIIQERLGRQEQSHQTQLTTFETTLQGLKVELQETKEKAKANPGEKKEGKAAIEELERQIAEVKAANKPLADQLQTLQTQMTEKDKLILKSKQEAVNIRKEVAIAKAATPVNFMSLEVAMKLTADSIKWEESKGKFVVIGENSQERLNSALEPMSLEEFYQEYAAKNPYLVRGDTKSGTGSTSGSRSNLSNDGKFEVKQIFGKESNAVFAQQLKRQNPAEYARLKEIAKSSGLIS